MKISPTPGDGIPEPAVARHSGPWQWRRRHGRVLLSDIAVRSPRIWSPEYRTWLHAEVDALVATGAIDRCNGDVLDSHIDAAHAEDAIRVKDDYAIPIAKARDVERQHSNRAQHAQDRLTDLDRQITDSHAQLEVLDEQLADRRTGLDYHDLTSFDTHTTDNHNLDREPTP